MRNTPFQAVVVEPMRCASDFQALFESSIGVLNTFQGVVDMLPSCDLDRGQVTAGGNYRRSI